MVGAPAIYAGEEALAAGGATRALGCQGNWSGKRLKGRGLSSTTLVNRIYVIGHDARVVWGAVRFRLSRPDARTNPVGREV
jgi:hypothetical protein